MVRPLRIAAATLMVVRGNVHLATDDGLYTMSAGFMKKICRRKKVSVVGNRNGRHAPARRLGRQFADFASAVEERVVRVQM